MKLNPKKLFIFFLLSVLVSFNCVFIFADESEPTNNNDDLLPISEENIPSSPSQVVVDITQLINNNRSDDDEEDIQIVENLEPQLVNIERSVQRVSPSDTSGLKAILLTILGDYDTVITDYTYQQNNYSYLSHSIQIERDWAWICSCGIFAILLYCTFRTIGGICSRF